jgi:hypothetical protein
MKEEEKEEEEGSGTVPESLWVGEHSLKVTAMPARR